jgi:hypothetical protein
MSDASSELGAAGRKCTVAELAARLHRKASAEKVSLSLHLSIGRLLCKLRDAIVAGEALKQTDAVRILCAGISFYRRHALGDVGDDEEDATDTIALLKQSATLIFVLLAAIESRANGLSARALESARATVEAARDATLTHVLVVPSRKRAASGDHDAAASDGAASDGAAWEMASQVTPGELTLNVLKIAASALTRPTGTGTGTGDLDALADIFFRSSAACMASRILLKDGGTDFVALSAQKSAVSREKRLLAFAQAGESEAGQSCLRDLLLSFLLPSKIIGVRRNLLLSRAASTAAGVDYADAVNSAHSCAMAGTEWIWNHGTSELERACALLAGIAVLVTRGGDDPMRKQCAFLGRVSLPFLETSSPADGVKRLALLPDKRRWILYRISPKTGKPALIASLCGFEGLCDCVLEFM